MIPQEHDLPIRVAGAGRNRQAAQLVGAAVKACTTSEKTIAVGNLDHIFIRRAGCRQGTRGAFVPEINILLGIKSHHAFSGGAGSRVNSDTL